MIVGDAIEIIKELKGVLEVHELSDDDKLTLQEIETLRNDDLIPIVNDGLIECLKRDHCLVMFKTDEFRKPPKPTVLLKTDKGRILGREIISIEDMKNYSNSDEVIFLSRNFILFKPDKITRTSDKEREFFLLPPIPFPELDEITGIEDVVSGSPSTKGDAYIKDKFGYPDDPEIATIIIAFSTKT